MQPQLVSFLLEPLLDQIKVFLQVRAHRFFLTGLFSRNVLKNLIDVSGLQRVDERLSLFLLLAHVHGFEVLVEQDDVRLYIIDRRESELFDELFTSRSLCSFRGTRSSGLARPVPPVGLVSAPLIFAWNRSWESC